MARALFISDLHAALKLPMARLESGGVTSDRLQDVVSLLEQVGQAASEEETSFVAILGDLFDAAHPDGATLVAVSRVLGELAREVQTYVLPGNHDAVDRDGRLYSLQFYGELRVPGLHVLGHETVKRPKDEILLHAVPWLPEARARKRIRSRARDLPKDARNFLLFHQGIRGASWDSGRPSTDGLEGDIGEGFDVALTGHYHRPQEFSSGRYLGAPLDLRFGDEDVEQRGFWSVDLDTLKATMIPTRYPRFATLRLTVEEVEGADLAHFLDAGTDDVRYLRIQVEDKASEIDKIRRKVDEWVQSASRYNLRVVRPDLRPTEERRERLEVGTVGISLAELTRHYATQFGPEGLDHEELAATGVRFLEEG